MKNISQITTHAVMIALAVLLVVSGADTVNPLNNPDHGGWLYGIGMITFGGMILGAAASMLLSPLRNKSAKKSK